MPDISKWFWAWLTSVTQPPPDRRSGKRERRLNDELTGLPGRDQLLNDIRLKLARRRCKSLAVAYIDLDGMKPLNDRYGHEGANKLIAQVADHLKRLMLPDEQLYRPGGDEFVVLMTNPDNYFYNVRAQELVQLVRQETYFAQASPGTIRLAKEVLRDGYQELISESGSIPVSIRCRSGSYYWQRYREMPTEEAAVFARDPAVCLVDFASKGLLSAKRLGDDDGFSDAVRFSKDYWDTCAMHDIAVQGAGWAIEMGKVSACYQPIYDSNTGMIVGFEAFADWAEIVFVPNGDYTKLIDGLESSGYLDILWQHLLRDGCRELNIWNPLTAAQHLVVSINLAPSQLVKGVAERALEVVEHYGVSPGQINFEITERKVLPSSALHAIESLAETGFGLILDDLTSGWSSPMMLGDFGQYWSGVKIDGRLIRLLADSPFHEMVARSIIDLSMQLPAVKTITAEGVEEKAQLIKAWKLGCNLFQGFLYSGKLSPEGATAAIRAAYPSKDE